MCLHSESSMLYRPALHGNWNALSLTRRVLKDKFPMPTIPLTAMLQNGQEFLPDPVYGCLSASTVERKVMNASSYNELDTQI